MTSTFNTQQHMTNKSAVVISDTVIMHTSKVSKLAYRQYISTFAILASGFVLAWSLLASTPIRAATTVSDTNNILHNTKIRKQFLTSATSNFSKADLVQLQQLLLHPPCFPTPQVSQVAQRTSLTHILNPFLVRDINLLNNKNTLPSSKLALAREASAGTWQLWCRPLKPVIDTYSLISAKIASQQQLDSILQETTTPHKVWRATHNNFVYWRLPSLVMHTATDNSVSDSRLVVVPSLRLTIPRLTLTLDSNKSIFASLRFNTILTNQSWLNNLLHQEFTVRYPQLATLVPKLEFGEYLQYRYILTSNAYKYRAGVNPAVQLPVIQQQIAKYLGVVTELTQLQHIQQQLLKLQHMKLHIVAATPMIIPDLSSTKHVQIETELPSRVSEIFQLQHPDSKPVSSQNIFAPQVRDSSQATIMVPNHSSNMSHNHSMQQLTNQDTSSLFPSLNQRQIAQLGYQNIDISSLDIAGTAASVHNLTLSTSSIHSQLGDYIVSIAQDTDHHQLSLSNQTGSLPVQDTVMQDLTSNSHSAVPIIPNLLLLPSLQEEIQDLLDCIATTSIANTRDIALFSASLDSALHHQGLQDSSINNSYLQHAQSLTVSQHNLLPRNAINLQGMQQFALHSTVQIVKLREQELRLKQQIITKLQHSYPTKILQLVQQQLAQVPYYRHHYYHAGKRYNGRISKNQKQHDHFELSLNLQRQTNSYIGFVWREVYWNNTTADDQDLIISNAQARIGSNITTSSPFKDSFTNSQATLRTHTSSNSSSKHKSIFYDTSNKLNQDTATMAIAEQFSASNVARDTSAISQEHAIKIENLTAPYPRRHIDHTKKLAGQVGSKHSPVFTSRLQNLHYSYYDLELHQPLLLPQLFKSSLQYYQFRQLVLTKLAPIIAKTALWGLGGAIYYPESSIASKYYAATKLSNMGFDLAQTEFYFDEMGLHLVSPVIEKLMAAVIPDTSNLKISYTELISLLKSKYLPTQVTAISIRSDKFSRFDSDIIDPIGDTDE